MEMSVESAPFRPLGQINTITATPLDTSLDQIRENTKRSYPRLHQFTGFKERKGDDFPVNLVGGGPSLNNFLQELKDQKYKVPIVACGSSYDFLVENGVIPDFCVLCDPDAITANYIQKAQGSTIFFVATCCHEAVFNTLENINATIYMWHCYNNQFEEMQKIEPDFQAVGGGCTVGLRSLSIFIMLGYSNIHFYGFDSCLGEKDKHHTYDFTDSTEELGYIYELKIDPNSSKVYRAAGYQMAQAQHFKDFYAEYAAYFTPVFHGEGLLPDLMAKIGRDADEIRKQQKV